DHIPEHVPKDLVFPFEHHDFLASTGDPFTELDKVASAAPPIFFSPKLGGFWVVTRFSEVFEVYRNNKLFSSRHIGVPPSIVPYELIPLQADPPVHGPYRRLLEPAFT